MVNQLLIISFGLLSLLLFFISLRKCRTHEGRIGRTNVICIPYGSFVWMDHIVLGPFWLGVSLLTLLLNDLLLFLLIFSTFWLVRSLGETLYWFLQQFHPREGNEPDKFWIHRIAPGQGVWFLNQLFWQCVTVISLITTLYLAALWLP